MILFPVGTTKTDRRGVTFNDALNSKDYMALVADERNATMDLWWNDTDMKKLSTKNPT
jgi:hypothetical protein